MTTLETRLETLAAAGDTVTYGALARELGWRMGELTAALETLMEEDARLGRPFRAALCVQRLSPGGLPAPGFFAKAAALGRAIPDPAAFITAERAALRHP